MKLILNINNYSIIIIIIIIIIASSVKTQQEEVTTGATWIGQLLEKPCQMICG
jgi:small-conductance mechanosensitive channel